MLDVTEAVSGAIPYVVWLPAELSVAYCGTLFIFTGSSLLDVLVAQLQDT